jgi:hypothetical protein
MQLNLVAELNIRSNPVSQFKFSGLPLIDSATSFAVLSLRLSNKFEKV